VLATLALGACRRESGDLFLTYYDGNHGLSLTYPASWRTDQANQEGVWYRYFLSPTAGPEQKPGASVTLLVGPLTSGLDEYAQVYLAGNTLASSKQELRQGVAGRSYLYGSAEGKRRHRLLLLEEAGRVYGLYAQGDAAPFESLEPQLERIFDSLRLERPASYPEQRDTRFAYALRIPPSWKPGRSLSTSDRLVTQHMSPPLAADAEGRTAHASLSVTVEAVPAPGALDDYYRSTRQLLGGSFRLSDHVRWRDGYADVMVTETPLSVSRLKRYYRVANGRGYSLSFEARDDVFHGVAAWFDQIAETLKVGPELSQ
jgi:hypothetical protein